MRIAERIDPLSDIKSVKTNVSNSLRHNCMHEDINSEEAALEMQQCISLLRKYDVLKDCDFRLSQTVPRGVPHPGSVGDGLLSKVCKTCGALEDGNSTVICDECEEAFHLSCCFPRMSLKYFDREDDWYCASCKRQKKNVTLKLSTEGTFKSSQIESIDSSGSPFPVDISYNSRVRLGPAHQADVPLWADIVEDNDQKYCVADHPGMELPLSQEEKNREKDCIHKSFEQKIQSLNWIPAEMLPREMPQNWLKCQCVLERAFKDSNGQKHQEVVCGKWRRAPLNFHQTDNWECFCAMEWDPLHADCAIPQELSNEEVLKQMQENISCQPLECGVFSSDTLGDTSRCSATGKSLRKQKRKLDG